MNRVFVVWSRIILPNGITVQINSPGTDALGKQEWQPIVSIPISFGVLSTIKFLSPPCQKFSKTFCIRKRCYR